MLDSLKVMIDTYGEVQTMEVMRGIFGAKSTTIAFIYAMRTGFISASELMEKNMNEPTAHRVIKKLRDLQVIKFFKYQRRRKRDDRGGPRTTVYIINGGPICQESFVQLLNLKNTKRVSELLEVG